LSLLSSDRPLRIESSVHEIDVVLIARASIYHVCLHSRISVQLWISKIERAVFNIPVVDMLPITSCTV
jgi:hypothetical protein